MSARICLLSGGDRVQLRSPENHRVYAELAGYDYRLETGPFPGLLSPYYFKLRAVANTLPGYDWVIWMDDDAFVTDFSRRTFDELIAAEKPGGSSLVIGDSPVSPTGVWTTINTGVFLVRRSPDAAELLEQAMAVPLPTVRAWWDDARFGSFTNGDQDAVVWALETHGLWPAVTVVDHRLINARSYEYESEASDRFVVHFPGVPSKVEAVSEFARRTRRDDTLLPPDLRQRFGIPEGTLLTRGAVRRRRLRRRVGRQARTVLGRLFP